MAVNRLGSGGEMDLGGLEMRLPVANEENKKLEAEVLQKEREVSSLQRQVEQLGDRVRAMGDHLKNVRQELVQTQVSSSSFSLGAT